VFQQY